MDEIYENSMIEDELKLIYILRTEASQYLEMLEELRGDKALFLQDVYSFLDSKTNDVMKSLYPQ